MSYGRRGMRQFEGGSGAIGGGRVPGGARRMPARPPPAPGTPGGLTPQPAGAMQQLQAEKLRAGGGPGGRGNRMGRGRRAGGGGDDNRLKPEPVEGGKSALVDGYSDWQVRAATLNHLYDRMASGKSKFKGTREWWDSANPKARAKTEAGLKEMFPHVGRGNTSTPAQVKQSKLDRQVKWDKKYDRYGKPGE